MTERAVHFLGPWSTALCGAAAGSRAPYAIDGDGRELPELVTCKRCLAKRARVAGLTDGEIDRLMMRCLFDDDGEVVPQDAERDWWIPRYLAAKSGLPLDQVDASIERIGRGEYEGAVTA